MKNESKGPGDEMTLSEAITETVSALVEIFRPLVEVLNDFSHRSSDLLNAVDGYAAHSVDDVPEYNTFKIGDIVECRRPFDIPFRAEIIGMGDDTSRARIHVQDLAYPGRSVWASVSDLSILKYTGDAGQAEPEPTSGDARPSLRVYLAGRYSRREELKAFADRLTANGGIEVTSRWLEGGHEMDGSPHLPVDFGRCQKFAIDDVQDIRAAHVVVCFTEPPGTGPSRGGRHSEMGIAWEAGKTILTVGPRENVFYCLDGVNQVDTTAGAISWLRGISDHHDAPIFLADNEKDVQNYRRKLTS